VIGYSQVLLDESLDEQERAVMLSTVVDQAADLSNIVDDLLVGARAELGQLDVDASPIDVGEVIDGSLRSFPYVNRIGDRLDDVYALGDAARIRQILRNLLSNAERYGGDDVVICPTVQSAETVEIAVCDSGPALKGGLNGKVFERYYREQGESRPTGSVGIGLTIARDLAQMMNGNLTYRHDGEWSEFVLTLPRAARRLRAVS
jgi:signal transduction histidine kinase